MLAWGIVAVISITIFLASIFALFVNISNLDTKGTKILAGLMWFSAPIGSVSGIIWFIYFVASFFN